MPQASVTSSNQPFQGLASKIGIIKNYYQRSFGYPSVRAFAEQMAMSPMGRPSPQALFANLKTYFRYVPDPVGAELIKAPWEMVRQIGAQGWVAGDCDDAASFSYTLLNMLGIPAVLVVGWYGQKDPSHIWTRIPLKGSGQLDFDLCGFVLGQKKPGATMEKTYA